MTKLPLPAKSPLWLICQFNIARSQLRAMLGEPHFIETDATRTSGGHEDLWAYTLPSGQRLVIQLRVPYNQADFWADPAELSSVLQALHIPNDDPRLVPYPEPFELT